MFTGPTSSAKVGRNDPCPCGSGKKYKHCCEGKTVAPWDSGPAGDSKHELAALRRKAGPLVRAGRWREALAPLEAIARLDPENPWAHYELGCALESRGSVKEAVARFRRALALKPGFDDAMVRLAAALERDEAGRAETGPSSAG